jgi:hypothetical protein
VPKEVLEHKVLKVTTQLVLRVDKEHKERKDHKDPHLQELKVEVEPKDLRVDKVHLR